MRWHIERDREGCPREKPWAVVDETGKVIADYFSDGKDAVAHVEKLSGSRGRGQTSRIKRSRLTTLATDDKPKVKPGGSAAEDEDENECPEGQRWDPETEECVPDEKNEDSEESAPFGTSAAISGVAAVEGKWTGDGRQFSLGSLTWPDPAETIIPMQWQKETSHGGVNDNTVNVGRVTELVREGDQIIAYASLDTGSDDGAEIARRLQSGSAGGVSIVADDPDQSDMEFVYPDGCDEMDDDEEIDFDDIARCFSPKVIFHGGRIRAITFVDTPAFVEAAMRFDGDEESVTASFRNFGAVKEHDTPTSDATWDAAEQEKKLTEPLTLDAARGMYAWIDEEAADGEEIAKTACKFPHHEVSDDGTPGAANLTACSAGIGALNGARAEPDIPATDRQGVYDHLAAHLRAADQEPPPPTFSLIDALEPLVAASHIIEIPDLPPAEWFSEPGDMPPIGAIHVTNEGRFYGLVAPRDIAHRSFTDRRVTVPTGNVDYSRWMNRETIVAGGKRIATGPITMNCGHTSTDSRVSSQMSMDHYDNSCSIVATARIGENKHGVWIAGALLSDIVPEQVARILACQLSGDWRPHREKPGQREFTGALLVPVPGFPVAANPAVRLDHGQLVASTAPVTWETVDDTILPEFHPGSNGGGKSTSGADAITVNDLPTWDDIVAKKALRSQIDQLAETLGIEVN